jgi:delta 1-pyrroline-5-carboxylate dehydrogenase
VKEQQENFADGSCIKNFIHSCLPISPPGGANAVILASKAAKSSVVVLESSVRIEGKRCVPALRISDLMT